MNKPILITGDRLAGLRETSQLIAWHYSPTETGIVRYEWPFEECENWEHHPHFGFPIQADTKVFIIDHLPDYFDFSRLWPLSDIKQFCLPDGQMVQAPKLIITSRYHPKMGVEKWVKKHYRLTGIFNF